LHLDFSYLGQIVTKEIFEIQSGWRDMEDFLGQGKQGWSLSIPYLRSLYAKFQLSIIKIEGEEESDGRMHP